MPVTDKDTLRQILTSARTIAVVGHSDRPNRTSYKIGRFLKRVGYTVYPVNPAVTSINGEPCYPSLAEVPEPIDLVNVFRRSVFLEGVVEEAIAAGAPAVWAQLGVQDEAAAQKAEAAGLQIVMDNCIMVAYNFLVG